MNKGFRLVGILIGVGIIAVAVYAILVFFVWDNPSICQGVGCDIQEKSDEITE